AEAGLRKSSKNTKAVLGSMSEAAGACFQSAGGVAPLMREPPAISSPLGPMPNLRPCRDVSISGVGMILSPDFAVAVAVAGEAMKNPAHGGDGNSSVGSRGVLRFHQPSTA